MKKVIAKFGDVGFPEYDGAVLFEENGRYLLEWLEWDDEREGRAYVSQYDVPDADTWQHEYWADNIEAIARTVGRTTKDLRKDLSSKDPKRRAAAIYYDVRGYTSLDDDPLRLTSAEVNRRYAGLKVGSAR